MSASEGETEMKRKQSPQVIFTLQAAKWAGNIGLAAGNMWEPGIVRAMMNRYRDLETVGAASTALVIEQFAVQLDLLP